MNQSIHFCSGYGKHFTIQEKPQQFEISLRRVWYKSAQSCESCGYPACKRCRERYCIVIEALDDIIFTTNNLELVTYRNTILDTETVYQITFLEDVLSVTNILSLLLQLDKKDFSTIAQPVTEVLKNFGENIDTNYLKNFNNANEIIEKIKVYERQNIVSFGLRKCQQQNHNLIKDILDKKVIKPFIDESIKEMKNAFNISNLPVLNAFLKLDPQKIPDKDSLLFENYGVEKVTLLHNFYIKGKGDSFQGRTVQADALYDTQLSCLLLEFSNFKSYVCEQKAALSQEYLGKEKSLQSKFDLFNAQKYKIKK